MIPQDALDQVRGRVMRRLRVRRAIRQGAVVAALLVAVLMPAGLRLPPAETLALARPAGPVDSKGSAARRGLTGNSAKSMQH